VLLLFLVIGCRTETPLCGVDGGSGCGVEGPADGAPPSFPEAATGPARPLDILFLIDNSTSTDDDQRNLHRAFPVFLDELRKVRGGLPDLHLGVVSSDLGAGASFPGGGSCSRPGGDRGILQARTSCGVRGNFLSSASNGTNNNFDGSLDQAFSCVSFLGGGGCGYEHQLQAIRLALDESITQENAGFLRPDAVLAIVIVSDEDDCSAVPTTDLFTDEASFPMTGASFRCSQVGHDCNGMPTPVAPFDVPLESCRARDGGRLIRVQEVVNSIRSLKSRPDQDIVVTGIIGWPTNPAGARYRYERVGAPGTPGILDVAPTCGSIVTGDAHVGLRLKHFVQSFGGSYFSICSEDYGPILQAIGAQVAARL
jgi:hypothetical protein